MQQEEDLKKLTKYAKIALATICIERGLGFIKKEVKLHKTISELVQDLWRWQTEDKISGKSEMSEDDARKLPSCYFYDKYSEVLLAVPSNEKINSYVRGTNVLHGFICWEMDALESILNPGKPFVLGNDIMDANMSWLVDGLERIANAANDPSTEAMWQQKAIETLLKHYSVKAGDYIGTPVTRKNFEDIYQ
jgi:hypothetical protein